MTVHIFNPEHDLALAHGMVYFTPPHAGRQLRHDLGWLPALWAAEGDGVLVDDVELAERSWKRLKGRLATAACCQPQFMAWKQLPQLSGEEDSIEPWGWNPALRASLARCGTHPMLLPIDSQIINVIELSHRNVGAALLPRLRVEGTVGEAFECQSLEEVKTVAARYGKVVLKAPWSSSGRGVRFAGESFAAQLSLDQLPPATANMVGWLKNILYAQGSVMVEPFYHKVKDFAMEFRAHGNGKVDYLGLSLFHTENGAYTGNILATEQAKRDMLARYLPMELLSKVQERICRLMGEVCQGRYEGPFGVDMMVVAHQSATLLHPCVEINLRRTMGHVALAAGRLFNPQEDYDLRHVMRIDYTNNNYKLRIRNL